MFWLIILVIIIVAVIVGLIIWRNGSTSDGGDHTKPLFVPGVTYKITFSGDNNDSNCQKVTFNSVFANSSNLSTGQFEYFYNGNNSFYNGLHFLQGTGDPNLTFTTGVLTITSVSNIIFTKNFIAYTNNTNSFYVDLYDIDPPTPPCKNLFPDLTFGRAYNITIKNYGHCGNNVDSLIYIRSTYISPFSTISPGNFQAFPISKKFSGLHFIETTGESPFDYQKGTIEFNDLINIITYKFQTQSKNCDGSEFFLKLSTPCGTRPCPPDPCPDPNPDPCPNPHPHPDPDPCPNPNPGPCYDNDSCSDNDCPNPTPFPVLTIGTSYTVVLTDPGKTQHITLLSIYRSGSATLVAGEFQTTSCVNNTPILHFLENINDTHLSFTGGVISISNGSTLIANYNYTVTTVNSDGTDFHLKLTTPNKYPIFTVGTSYGVVFNDSLGNALVSLNSVFELSTAVLVGGQFQYTTTSKTLGFHFDKNNSDPDVSVLTRGSIVISLGSTMLLTNNFKLKFKSNNNFYITLL